MTTRSPHTPSTRKLLTSSPLSDTSPPRQMSLSSSFNSPVGSSSPHHVDSALKVSKASSMSTANNFQQRMANLRKENSQIVSQSQRLLDRLETSSNKLLSSNSMHQQTSSKEEDNYGHQSLLDREKREWSIRQASLQQQVADAQAECRRIKTACSEVEQRTGRRGDSMIDRPTSSQSHHGFSMSRHHPSYLPTTISSRVPDSIRHPPTTFNSHHHTKQPTLTRSLSGSNSSLTSIKSATNDYSSIPTHSTLLLEAELERARLSSKRLQKQVSVLEQQLADKRKSSEGHVQELSHLRTLLAKEKADHAMASHSASEKAASELGRLKALHVEQTSELEAVVQRMKADKKSNEEECDQLRASLKTSQSEAKKLSDNVSSLLSQLEAEKNSHQEAMSKLQKEAEEGGRQVNQLQEQLESCKRELNQCVRQVEGEVGQVRKDAEEYRQQVTVLSAQLDQCRGQLASGTAAIHQLQHRLQETELYMREERDGYKNKEAELLQCIEQCEAEKQQLSHRLEEIRREMSSHTQKLAGLQESSLLCRQQEGELSQLRRALSEQQTHRQELERVNETAEKEKERAKGEVVELRQRLEAACQQLSEMQGRSESWRADREQQRAHTKELQTELEKAQRERDQAVSELKKAQATSREKDGEVDASLTQMQMELTKRAQQVMELDSLLRSHQADTTAKRLQLERTLAQRQADLRSRTQEVEELSSKLSQALQNIDKLQQQLQEESENQLHSNTTTDLLRDKEVELGSVYSKLEEAKRKNEAMQAEVQAIGERENRSKEKLKLLEEKCAELTKNNKSLKLLEEKCAELTKNNRSLQQLQHAHSASASSLSVKEEELASLRQQVQTLVHQDRVRQEELARCRAQVASLSAELAVERQMVDETRKELAETRAGKVVPAFSLPPQTHLPSHTIPSATHSTHTTNGINSYPPAPSSGHSSIIHI